MNFNVEPLLKANDRRSLQAAHDNVQRARKALVILRANPPKTSNKDRGYVAHVAALTARIDHPRDSLAEIAHRLGQTKDVYSSALRRAFIYADRVKYSRV